MEGGSTTALGSPLQHNLCLISSQRFLWYNTWSCSTFTMHFPGELGSIFPTIPLPVAEGSGWIPLYPSVCHVCQQCDSMNIYKGKPQRGWRIDQTLPTCSLPGAGLCSSPFTICYHQLCIISAAPSPLHHLYPQSFRFASFSTYHLIFLLLFLCKLNDIASYNR